MHKTRAYLLKQTPLHQCDGNLVGVFEGEFVGHASNKHFRCCS